MIGQIAGYPLDRIHHKSRAQCSTRSAAMAPVRPERVRTGNTSANVLLYPGRAIRESTSPSHRQQISVGIINQPVSVNPSVPVKSVTIAYTCATTFLEAVAAVSQALPPGPPRYPARKRLVKQRRFERFAHITPFLPAQDGLPVSIRYPRRNASRSIRFFPSSWSSRMTGVLRLPVPTRRRPLPHRAPVPCPVAPRSPGDGRPLRTAQPIF